jgi:CRP-like cAMP-binding protein
MTESEIVAMLGAHPFLKGMSAAHLASLAECVQPVTVSAGQLLGREKEPANFFYLLQSGRVAIEIHTPDRGNVRIQTLGPGEMVGWSWLVPPYRWQFDARVVEPVKAIGLNAQCLRGKCETDHELGYELLKRLVSVIASRLAATRVQLLDVYR